VVEKPKPAVAPSNLAIVGRYVLPGRIFDLLESTKPGAGGEIQLTDAIASLLAEQRVLAYRFEGTRFDCGSKLGLVKATLHFAMQDPTLADAVREYVRDSGLVTSYSVTVHAQSAGTTCASRKSATRLYASI